MRLRTYIDGHPAWSENTPSYARLAGHGGSLVVATPKPRPSRAQERQKIAVIAARLAAGEPPLEPRKRADPRRFYATDEERLEARRRTFRESRARLRAQVRAARSERAS